MSREDPRERCSCGNWPRFGCRQISEDTVLSQFTCPTGQRIPGGGTMGCGKEGPEVEDAYSDRATAASGWDAMRRKERRAEGTGQ